MKFSILFWNVWYVNQVEGEVKRGRLFAELKRLAQEYQPDIVAFAEIVCPTQETLAPVIRYMQKLGYDYYHHAAMAQFDDYWKSGVVLCSRFPLSRKQNIVISKNGYAAKHGHPGLDKEAIGAEVVLPGGGKIKVIVAHPSATVDSMKEHRKGMKSLERLAHSKAYEKNAIMVGDMNQWRLIPGALRRRVAGVMHSRTGTILNPTWRHKAGRFTPLRLNLDYVYWSKRGNLSLKDFKALSSDVSDHRPLLAGFEYTE